MQRLRFSSRVNERLRSGKGEAFLIRSGMDNRAFELDFLPVGNSSRSGDAIAFRSGIYESGIWKNQEIFIVDGGNSDSGEKLVEHVNEVYKSDRVDRVFLTHPDADHASGLRIVIRDLEVGKIWMHRPWNYWSDLQDSIIDGRVTKKSFGDRLREAYQYAHDIEQIALTKNPKVEIFAPHQGNYYESCGEKLITVLGPSKELYLSLIEQSEKNPHLQGSLGSSSLYKQSPKTQVYEDLSFETEHLTEDEGRTSPENDMSLVLLLNLVGTKILLTGDSGTMGLYNAIRYAVSEGVGFDDLKAFQVPHHGSRHNLSKGILDYLMSADYGLISCAPQSDHHPAPVVINSLIRRNIIPYAANGNILTWHSDNVPGRPDYGSAVPLSFSSYVEIPIEA